MKILEAGETLNNFLLTGILDWKDNLFDSTCCPKEGHRLKTMTDFNYCWRASLLDRVCGKKVTQIWPETALIVGTSTTIRQTLKALYTKIMKCNLPLFFKLKRLHHLSYYTCTKIMIMWSDTAHSVETSTSLRLTSVHHMNKYHENLAWHCTYVYNTPAHIVYHMNKLHEIMTWHCT